MDKEARLKEAYLVQKFATDEIERLEAQLAEAEKTKLRHTDFGWDEYGNPCGAIEVIETKGLRAMGHGAVCSAKCNDVGSLYVPETVAFNAMDDLAALAEDLEGFEFDDLEVKVSSIGSIWLLQDKDEIFVPKKDIPDFVLNLRRMLATMQRKAAGNENM